MLSTVASGKAKRIPVVEKLLLNLERFEVFQNV